LKKKQKPYFASSVPNLSFDDHAIDVQGPHGELDSNSGLGLEVKLVLSEFGEHIQLAETGHGGGSSTPRPARGTPLAKNRVAGHPFDFLFLFLFLFFEFFNIFEKKIINYFNI
jgi:hypothetical protein